MSIPRKLAVLVVTGVPVIVGGGIVYALSGHSYPMVGVYEILLAGAALWTAKNVK